MKEGILAHIGRTPLVRIARMTGGLISAKAEFLNPGGSIKDRVAVHMILGAEKKGLLKPGMTIVEPSSGNTGIGLALVGVQRGYRVIVVMPSNMSEERCKIIRALGGELERVPAKEGLAGCVRRVDEMAAADEKVYVPQQFKNPLNPEVHYIETGPEIWEQTNGDVSAFVAGVGSGGTLQGVGKFLRERKPGVKLVAVEPENSAALLGREPGLHRIDGIGDGFVPDVLDVSIISQVVTVTDDDAIETTRRIAREEGMLVGTSSGANVWASMKVAEGLPEGSQVVTVLPDRAERYFSTALI